MKVLYFDAFAGASGDMILGALVDAGADFEILRNELSKLNLSGYELTSKNHVSKGISGTKVDVISTEDHHHRGLTKINQIIDESDLSPRIKEKSKKVFLRLGEAEAKIHNKTVDEIHFHEVGAVDSIIDIVGSVIALDLLKIEKIYSSKLITGKGTVKCAHGILPVPAPATLELLKNVPFESGEIETEMLTPTGAAVISTLAEDFGSIPEIQTSAIGYGFGSKELPVANFLRVIIGEENAKYQSDIMNLIETNIDDMNPEFYEYVMEKLFSAGAKDVFLQQIIMKKNRPGIILSVLAAPEKTEELSKIIFAETTTLGIRISEQRKRRMLLRGTKEVDTEFGKMRVKIKEIEGKNIFMPEYDECRRVAEKENLPLKDVYELINRLNDK